MIQDSYCLKLDWLGFTYQTNDHTVGTLPIDHFKEDFPEFIKVLEESTISSVKSHYTNTLTWDNDLFIAFNVPKEDSTPSAYNHMWTMGVNVQVPSHALEDFFNLFGMDIKDDFIVPRMFKLLQDRGCMLSRLDLNFDDFNYRKTYTAKDYAKFYYQERIESPFSISSMGSDRSGYTTYFGSLKKRSKLLRIYDKFKESDGLIDAVRYEWEFHSEQARDLSDFIINECPAGLDFSKFIYSFLKVHSVDCSSYNRINDSPLDEEWVTFLLTGFKNEDDWKRELRGNDFDDLDFNEIKKSRIIPYRVPKNDSRRRKKELTHFINYQAMPSICGYVECYGENELLDVIHRNIKAGNVNEKYKREKHKLLRSDEYWEDVNFIDNPFL